MRVPLVVVPTYNELENISRMVPTLLDLPVGADVLVVDDNSPDGTGDAVRRMSGENDRVHLLHRPCKAGLGQAYVAGFGWALERGYGPVVQMDADFSHDPSRVPDLIGELDGADLVIGSRYCSGVNVVNWPIGRLLLSWLANQYTRVITGMPVSDATGGFKAFTGEALAALDLASIRSDGYSFQIEVTYQLYRKGFDIREVPIIFVDRHAGTSKMTRSIVWEAVWMVWRLRFPWLF